MGWYGEENEGTPRERGESALARCKAIAAKAGDREFTAAEKSEYDTAHAEAEQCIAILKKQRADQGVYDVARRISNDVGLPPMTAPGGSMTKAGVRRTGPALALPEPVLKEMFHAVRAGRPFNSRGLMEEHSNKAFSTIDSLLPPQLSSVIVGPEHPDRLLDRLPVLEIQAPSWEFMRHTSTTGTPAITGEGQPKPELVFVTDKVIATAQKIAANVAISHESLQDFSTFLDYVQTELSRQAIDVENSELLNGDGTAGHLFGLCRTSGILTHALTGPETSLDAIEVGITNLKVGPALADADLIVTHPATWSSIRRTKDTQGRYLVAPDPTAGEANSAWGVSVLTTVVATVGEALILDSAKFGEVLLREPMGVHAGWSMDDQVRNLTRLIVEERLALAVERPGALLLVTGL